MTVRTIDAALSREFGVVVDRIQNVSGDGDCLFSSLSLVCGGTHSATSLRRLVAKTVLLSHRLLDEACKMWKQLAPSELPDFNFYRGLEDEPLPLSANAQRRLATSMLDRALYWGDDYSLSVLSVLMRRKICVVCVHNRQATLHVKRPVSELNPPAFVLLVGDHYQAVFVRTARP